VVAEPSGRRVLYDISDARLRHALQDLVGVVLAVDPVDACDVNATVAIDHATFQLEPAGAVKAHDIH
jgi:hypothetical protein